MNENEDVTLLDPKMFMWCFYIALAILIVFGIWTIINITSNRKKKKDKIPFVYILFAGVLLSSVCLFFPIYWFDVFHTLQFVDKVPWLKSAVLSLHNTIRLFILDGDFVIIQQITERFNGGTVFGVIPLKSAYDGLAAFLYLVAPLLTFGFILTFFKTLKARIRFFRGMHFGNEMYIFNELNRKSILLAESIYNENKELRNGSSKGKRPRKAVIVFCEVDEKDEGDFSDLVDRANEINAILFKKEVTSLSFDKKKKVKVIKTSIEENEPVIEEEDLSDKELPIKREEVMNSAKEYANEYHKEHPLKEDALNQKLENFKTAINGTKKLGVLNKLLDEFKTDIYTARVDYVPGDELKAKQDEALAKGEAFVKELRKGHELYEETAKEKIDAFVLDVKGAPRIEDIDPIYEEFIAVIDRTRKDYTPADYIPEDTRTRINFFFMHVDQTDNVRHYFDIFKELKSRKDVSLYLFSTKPASELALNHSNFGDDEEQCLVRRRRVTIDTFFIYRYLYEQGTKIFDNLTSTIEIEKNGKKEQRKVISVVIVGLGMYGTQFLQAMAWYSQMDGYYLKINAFDSDPLAEEKFAGMCPELMDEEHNKKIIPGDAQYDITIHPNCPIKTKKFNDEIAKIKDVSTCFTCLGNDDFNIEAALELRMQFERHGLHPSVNAIVQEIGDDITKGAINFKKQQYDINFIGSDEEAYSASSILGSELEEEAKIAHVAYSQTRGQVADAIYEFYMYEYNYLSSCATVIHRRAKKHCHIPGMDVPAKERTKFQQDTIELLEHKRWNAWIRSKGYIWSGSTNKSSRNDLGRKHHDIVPYAELTEDEKRKDGLVSF